MPDPEPRFLSMGSDPVLKKLTREARMGYNSFRGERSVKKAISVTLYILLALLMLAVLELNRNRLIGSIIIVLCAAGVIALRLTVLSARPWYLKLSAVIGFIGLFAAVLFLTWPPTRAVPASVQKNPEYTGVYTVAQGKLRGVTVSEGKVELFAGIPYAKPPVGDLRWREPQDPDAWDGVLDADTFAPMSMQPVNLPIYDSLAQIIGYHDYRVSLSDNHVPPVSEDSLYLNVWRPAGEVSGAPVLVFIHGGSLQTGQPWYGDYSGEGLAREGVIVVNMGYRLGIFGFMAADELIAESPNGTTGNYGLLDQIKALEWVRDNIAAFGGDPDNITLAGESAGAVCVSALCTSPLAKGLFRRVILESSTLASVTPPHSFRTRDDALAAGSRTLAKYGCKNIDELRKIPADKLAREADTHHHLTVDGYALTETPYESYAAGRFNEAEILHGYNKSESEAFILFDQANRKNYKNKVNSGFGAHAADILELYPGGSNAASKAAWAEVWGARFFDYSHYCLNRLAAANGIPVYEYYFTKTNGRLGAWHSGEMIYFYGNIPAGSKLFDARDRELSAQMTGYFVNFIRTGDPNESDLPRWEINTDSVDLLEFGEETRMVKERKTALYEIFDRIDGWTVEIRGNS